MRAPAALAPGVAGGGAPLTATGFGGHQATDIDDDNNAVVPLDTSRNGVSQAVMFLEVLSAHRGLPTSVRHG